MNRTILDISFKMIIAGIIALVLGSLLKLTFYTTASAAAILSIQLTKKDFIIIAIKRLVSSLISISFAAIFFYYFGQSFFSFSIYLIIFILASWLFNAPEGIVLSVVLVSHFFIVETITFAFYLEEVLLIIVSLATAFLVNMFYPESSVSKMNYTLYEIDSIIENYMYAIIGSIEGKFANIQINYESQFETLLNNAKLIDRNILIQNDHRYITYIYMRQMQFNTLKNIETNLKRIKYNHHYTRIILRQLKEISKNISFHNNASKCLVALYETNDFFLNEPMPVTREEFETRALLFQILNEIESFLKLKIEFHNKYPSFSLGGETNEVNR